MRKHLAFALLLVACFAGSAFGGHGVVQMAVNAMINGTAAAPSASWAANNDRGMFNDTGNSAVGITAGGTERCYVAAGGLTMSANLTVGANTLSLASSTVSGTPTWSSNQAITLSTASQPNVTSLGTLTSLTMGGTLTMGANTLALASATVSGTPTWSSNQAITLSTASQPNITSVGTLAGLTMTGTLAMSSTPVINGSPACTLGATTVTTLTASGATQLTAGAPSISKYANVSTQGWGVPAIYAAARSAAQTASVASVAAYTVGAADGTFLVSANVLVTASTTHSINCTVAYTDEGNTARTLTLNFSQVTGAFLTAITNVQGTGAYEGVPMHIRCKASTSITIATSGTFTSVTYNVDGLIQQVS